jgi:hypothetical protein
MTIRGYSLFVCIVSFCAACAGPKPYEISQADQQRFAPGLIRVERAGKPPLIEGLRNCIVYKAQYDGRRISGWKAALGADWGATSYPAFMTGCVEESLAYRNGEVRVYLCARALGAGGGCNNGGYYRSRTGERPWMQSDDNVHWSLLPP